MGKVVAEATVSLDGYIAGPNESGFEHLFAWFAGGDFEFPLRIADAQATRGQPGGQESRLAACFSARSSASQWSTLEEGLTVAGAARRAV